MNAFVRRLLIGATFAIVFAGFAILAYMLHSYQDPEHFLIKTLVNEKNEILQAFFSRDDNLKDLLIKLIQSEKKEIKVAIYTLSNKEIAHALINAYKRGIAIEIVTDGGYERDRYSKIPWLLNDNIPVWVYESEKDDSIMHNKFCIFTDNILHKSILWTGSYNFTVRATTRNQENIIILDNNDVIHKYSKQFAVLQSRSLLLKANSAHGYEKQRKFKRQKNY